MSKKPRVKAGTSKNTVLTPKQKAFARAYIRTGNACEAYRQAYDAKKMNQVSIGKEAAKLIAHPQIARMISDVEDRATEGLVMDTARDLQEALVIAHGKADEPLTWGAKLKALDMLFRHQGLYEKDNAQQAESLVLKIVAAGAPK